LDVIRKHLKHKPNHEKQVHDLQNLVHASGISLERWKQFIEYGMDETTTNTFEMCTFPFSWLLKDEQWKRVKENHPGFNWTGENFIPPDICRDPHQPGFIESIGILYPEAPAGWQVNEIKLEQFRQFYDNFGRLPEWSEYLKLARKAYETAEPVLIAAWQDENGKTDETPDIEVLKNWLKLVLEVYPDNIKTPIMNAYSQAISHVINGGKVKTTDEKT